MSIYYSTYYPSYLEHHGILGMKWGVRRYQNKDGSYTNAGKKHYDEMTSAEKRAYTNKKNFRKKQIKRVALATASAAAVIGLMAANGVFSSKKARAAFDAGRKAVGNAFKRHAKETVSGARAKTPQEARDFLNKVMREAAEMERNGGMDINMKERVINARNAYKEAKAAAAAAGM